jgi:hypothetical protein
MRSPGSAAFVEKSGNPGSPKTRVPLVRLSPLSGGYRSLSGRIDGPYLLLEQPGSRTQRERVRLDGL